MNEDIGTKGTSQYIVGSPARLRDYPEDTGRTAESLLSDCLAVEIFGGPESALDWTARWTDLNILLPEVPR